MLEEMYHKKVITFHSVERKVTYAVPVPRSAIVVRLSIGIIGCIRPPIVRLMAQCWKFRRTLACSPLLSGYMAIAISGIERADRGTEM
jgi:hypothetical protein